MKTLPLSKAELRRSMRRLKAACPAEERAALSQRIVAQLECSPRWQRARTVLLYHSLPDEVDTHELIRRAAGAGKRVLLPVVVGDELEIKEFHTENALTEGAFHILGPTGAAFADTAAIDLAVVPGVAFTPDGRRLGRGRGYYDRLLARLPYVHTCGICWPFQLVDDIPAEPQDIAMAEIITLPAGSPC